MDIFRFNFKNIYRKCTKGKRRVDFLDDREAKCPYHCQVTGNVLFLQSLHAGYNDYLSFHDFYQLRCEFRRFEADGVGIVEGTAYKVDVAIPTELLVYYRRVHLAIRPMPDMDAHLCQFRFAMSCFRDDNSYGDAACKDGLKQLLRADSLNEYFLLEVC